MNVLTCSKKLPKVFQTTSPLLLLHFHAPGCRASQDLARILTELVDRYKEELELRQINVEEFPMNQLLIEYAVLSLPTILIFCEGFFLAKIPGFISKQKLTEKINQLLKERDQQGYLCLTTYLPSSLFSY